MLRSRCWIDSGSVEDSVVDAWSCSRIALCGLSSSCGFGGDKGPSGSGSFFDGEGAEAVVAMSASHSPRSFFSLSNRVSVSSM